MNIRRLKEYKGKPKLGGSLLDFMGREELAANLFRITQTELKIKGEKVKGQQRLEAVAEDVGVKVRRTMQEISGVNPEDLPLVSAFLIHAYSCPPLEIGVDCDRVW